MQHLYNLCIYKYIHEKNIDRVYEYSLMLEETAAYGHFGLFEPQQRNVGKEIVKTEYRNRNRRFCSTGAYNQFVEK